MKKFCLFLALVMVLSLFAGCGPAENPTDPPAENPVDGTNPVAEGTVASENYKDQVVIGFQSKTTTTNPVAASNVAHSIFFQLTHNSLTSYDETTGQIGAELATDWTHNDDLTEWTFNLRDDVTFHNGEQFTADDVAFTVEYGKTDVANDTVKKFYNGIASVEAISDYQVKITLAVGNVDFPYALSNAYLGIVNREAVEADADNGASIGTGAFINKEFVSGDHTLLERNDAYWGTLGGSKSLLFRYISDGSARLIALENGEIDVCQSPNNTELSLIESNKNLVMHAYQASTLTYLGFNMTGFLGEDFNLRMAIAHALNIQEIIDGAASGFATISTGMWGAHQFGYYDDWAAEGMSNYDYNLEIAKDYMAKSNYPDGCTIRFMTSNAWRVKALVIIQQQLAPLNIEVVIEEVDAAGQTNKVNSGDYDVVMGAQSLTAAGTDANKFYQAGNGSNTAKYDNERVQELLNLASATADEAQRLAYYKELQIIVHTECPYIPLYYANSGVVCSVKVEGAVINTSGSHDYSGIRVLK